VTEQWDGIHDDSSDIDSEALSTAVGVSFFVEGELRRRPGLTYCSANGGIALPHFRSPVTGSWLLVVKSTGAVESVAL
jgi:hypothetical protein